MMKRQEIGKLVRILRTECTLPYSTLRLMRNAADAIGELQTQVPKWISIRERPPDLNVVVQITDGKEVGHGYLGEWRTPDGVRVGWCTPFADIDEEHITHWMPLPEPPKEET